MNKDRSHRRRRRSASPRQAPIPHGCYPLRQRDLATHRAIFTEYLRIHKDLDLSCLSDDEAKGRWKSFTNKWNSGSLAEGWYLWSEPPSSSTQNTEPACNPTNHYEDEEDEYGPAAPTHEPPPRDKTLATLRKDLKAERKVDKARFEELNPRAPPGSRERFLEKKRETAAANKSFRERNDDPTHEIADKDLMGDNGDEKEEIRKRLEKEQRQKSEREMKREEVLRAREAEREERLAKYRAKEEKTMEMLMELARKRFG
ncbi:hypothetical protein K470DRAFT_259052, partial [Piedraia hortae CBS 480.64]